jgi:type II secretory pathway component PulF
MIAPLTPFPDDRGAAPAYGGGDPVVQAVARATAAGLPLAEALEAYSDEAYFRGANTAFRSLGRAVRNGVPLEEAVAQVRPALSGYVAGLVRAAAGSGRLTAVLEQHLMAERRVSDIRFRYWMSAAYPIVLLSVAWAVLIAMLVFFVPAMEELLKDFGVPLPGPTRLTIGASRVAVGLLPWWPVVTAVLLALAVGIWSIRYLPGRPARVRLFQSLPLFGSVKRSVGLSEFCGLLALLVECRTPLPGALRLTAGALHDPNLAEGSLRLAERCEQGLPADQEIAYLVNFPESLAPIFRWDGRADAFGRGLRAAAELFAAQARVQTWVAGSFLQPFALAGVIVIVGCVALTLFWPLYALMVSLT